MVLEWLAQLDRAQVTGFCGDQWVVQAVLRATSTLAQQAAMTPSDPPMTAAAASCGLGPH